MRLFISVELPDSIKKILISLQDQITSPETKLSLVNDFHLTLKFLGDVPESKVDGIKERLGKISFDPFDVSLDASGVFPDKSYIRVVWIGLKPEDKIDCLQGLVEDSLQGLFPKEKDFKAHLTLARVKFIKDKDSFIGKIDKLKAPKEVFRVECIKLMKSTLTGEGPLYEEIGSFGK